MRLNRRAQNTVTTTYPHIPRPASRLSFEYNDHAAPRHPRDTGQHLAGSDGINPVPPIPLPDHLVTRTVVIGITTGGIGARSGVEAVRAR